jgi:hypothetical protein
MSALGWLLVLVFVMIFAFYVYLIPNAVDFYANPDPSPRFKSMGRLE